MLHRRWYQPLLLNNSEASRPIKGDFEYVLYKHILSIPWLTLLHLTQIAGFYRFPSPCGRGARGEGELPDRLRDWNPAARGTSNRFSPNLFSAFKHLLFYNFSRPIKGLKPHGVCQKIQIMINSEASRPIKGLKSHRTWDFKQVFTKPVLSFPTLTFLQFQQTD